MAARGANSGVERPVPVPAACYCSHRCVLLRDGAGLRQSGRSGGRQRAGQFSDGRLGADDHQQSAGHHQLAVVLDRRRRNHPLRSADRGQRRPQSHRHPESFGHPRRPAVQRACLSHQPERHRVWRGLEAGRRRSGRLDAQYLRCGFSCRAAALSRNGRRRQRRQSRNDQHRFGRQRLPGWLSGHQSGPDHDAAGGNHPRCRQIRRTGRPGDAEPAGRGGRHRPRGAQPGRDLGRLRADRHLRRPDQQRRHHQCQYGAGRQERRNHPARKKEHHARSGQPDFGFRRAGRRARRRHGANRRRRYPGHARRLGSARRWRRRWRQRRLPRTLRQGKDCAQW